MGFKYLKNKTSIFVVDEELFDTFNLSDGYINNQKIGHEKANDYHIDNCYSTALEDCISYINSKFNVDITINTHTKRIMTINDLSLYDYCTYNNERNLIDNINNEIQNWCNTNHVLTKAYGINYYDFINKLYKTIIFENEINLKFQHDLSIISDINKINFYDEVLQNKILSSNDLDYIYYEYQSFDIIQFKTNNFFSFQIKEKKYEKNLSL